MSNRIFSGYSNSFDTGIATYFQDVNVAIVLNHIIFWLKLNKSKGVNQIEGKTWMFETTSDIAAQFDYFSEKQVKLCIYKLLEHKILIKGNFSKNKFDRTSWYALADESMMFKKENTKGQNCPIARTEQSDLTDDSVPSIYNDKDKKQDKKKDTQAAIALCVFGSFVKLKKDEYQDLEKKFGKKELDDIIEDINDYCASKGTSYKDYAATIRSWAKKRKTSNPGISGSIEENIVLARRAETEAGSKNYRIVVCSTHIEIIPNSGQQIPDVIKYADKGFKEQLENILRKREFYRKKL